MHHSNANWYWNSAATYNHLTSPALDSISMPTASALSSNAILTDVGICLGMSNVNLNSENIPHCCKYSIPRPLLPPNWYNSYAQYILPVETAIAKCHPTPLLVSNGLNTLIVNEYSSANMRNEINQIRRSQIPRSDSSPGELNCPGANDVIPGTSKSLVTGEDMSKSLFAPPKKKWIRHYMMGE